MVWTAEMCVFAIKLKLNGKQNLLKTRRFEPVLHKLLIDKRRELFSALNKTVNKSVY